MLTPPASPSKTPVPADHYAFAFTTAGRTVLVRYRKDLHDVAFFPQAGFGVGNVSEPYPDVFCYDLDFDVFLYDSPREERIKLVDGLEVGGFAFSPSLDDDDELYFLGTSDPHLAARGIGFAYMKLPGTRVPVGPPTPKPASSPVPSATPSPDPTGTPGPPDPLEGYDDPRDGAWLGKPRAILPLNAFAARHGGLTSLRIASHGDGAVCSTADGGLYLYRTRDHVVMALLPDALIKGGMHADSPRIDPFFNRYIVWQDLKGGLAYVMDLWTGSIDPVPYLNLANGGLTDPDPKFVDAFEVVFNVPSSPDSEFRRLLVYNVVTEDLWTPGALLGAFFVPTPRQP
ncbi:MAG TPA: hypothetical protein V6D05_04510 [Stenomitos sp.]